MTSQTTTLRTAPQTRIRILLLGMLMALAATFAVTTWAQPMGGMGGGMGMHGHPGGGMMGGPEGMARMLDNMLDGLNATDDQRAQIKQIAQAASADLRAQREASRGLHQRALQIFTAPNVDAAAAETLRQQMLAQHDQASKRMTQAMVDMARVLTPDQRAKIGQRMKDRMDRMQKERGTHHLPANPSASQPRQ